MQASQRVGVELLPDTRGDDVVRSADAAVVVSEAGEFTSDLALAADGLRSVLRGKLSDDQPIASGYVAYRGAFPLSDIDVELDENALRDVVVYMGPGCHGG